MARVSSTQWKTDRLHVVVVLILISLLSRVTMAVKTYGAEYPWRIPENLCR
jgi:hypothetical protein